MDTRAPICWGLAFSRIRLSGASEAPLWLPQLGVPSGLVREWPLEEAFRLVRRIANRYGVCSARPGRCEVRLRSRIAMKTFKKSLPHWTKCYITIAVILSDRNRKQSARCSMFSHRLHKKIQVGRIHKTPKRGSGIGTTCHGNSEGKREHGDDSVQHQVFSHA